jgi:hypothetical protein
MILIGSIEFRYWPIPASREKAIAVASEEFQAVYPLVIGWIRETLAANAENAQSVGSKGFARLPLYFGNELLEATKVVAVDRVPVPPLSSFGLSRLAHFERVEYDGIAYLDTFFVKQTLAGDESLHFHELIHVVQWAVLGPERFVAMYADGLQTFGYRHSPLENMAYFAQSSFCRSNEIFDAKKFVAQRLSEM